MGNLLLWLLTIELLGLAALPLTAFLFRAFPDRGYGLSKIMGLLLVAFLNWWLGSVVSLANYPLIQWLLAVLVLVGGLALYRVGYAEPPQARRALRTTILIEEVLFLVAFLGWALVRSENPAIYGTEKPMDFMLLQVSGMTHSFPPPDAWLSGHTVNYYYLGYAIFAMLGRMAGVDPRYGFNLSNVTVFALGCVGAYSLTLALLRSRLWAFAGSFALIVAGDLDGIGQVITQIQDGSLSWHTLNLWCSTRVIGGGCANYHTITEFPIFSMIWNDLHPHVMALPFALLAIGIACSALLDPPDLVDSNGGRAVRLLLAAIVLGALFPINSWDYPTYLVLALVAMLIAAYRRDARWGRTVAELVGLVIASLLVYIPYYLTVHLAGQGIGLQSNPSDLHEVLTVIGGLLIPALLFAFWRAGVALVAPDDSPEDSPARAWLSMAPFGWGYFAIGAAILLLLIISARTDILLLCGAICAAYAIWMRLRREVPEMLFALCLTLFGVLVLLAGDYVYLRDIFANGPNYRMNTVFKLYYQGWILLSFAAVYCIASILRALQAARAGLRWIWVALAIGLAFAVGIYPLFAIPSQSTLQSIPAIAGPQAHTTGLDGLAYLRDIDPQEYNAIEWVRQHTTTTAVIAEASGTDAPANTGCTEYWVCPPQQSFNKVSALSGRPTIIGWPGSHESLWRGASNPSVAEMLKQREDDVRTIFTTTNPQVALGILRHYNVRYVYVGPVERATYVTGMGLPATVLTKFSSILSPAYRNPEVTIYSMSSAQLVGS